MAGDDNNDVRARILSEAARLFGASGYHGISMREIAMAAGVSKAGLYYHFKDKEDLFLALLADTLSDLAALIQTARQQPTIKAQVRAVIQALLGSGPRHGSAMRMAEQELDHLSNQARAAFYAVYHQQFVGQVRAILEAGMASGELRPLDSAAATWVLLGMIHPFIASPYAHPDEATIDLISSMFFHGAAAR